MTRSTRRGFDEAECREAFELGYVGRLGRLSTTQIRRALELHKINPREFEKHSSKGREAADRKARDEQDHA